MILDLIKNQIFELLVVAYKLMDNGYDDIHWLVFLKFQSLVDCIVVPVS